MRLRRMGFLAKSNLSMMVTIIDDVCQTTLMDLLPRLLPLDDGNSMASPQDRDLIAILGFEGLVHSMCSMADGAWRACGSRVPLY